MSRLSQLRAEQKFIDQHGIIRPEERARLEPLINALLDRLILGLPTNPKKSWAMAEMKKTVSQFYLEDTELREPSIGYIQKIISILGIKSTDRAFYRYMIFI